jgi:hypothetical protein
MHTPEQSFKNFKFKNPLSEKSKNSKPKIKTQKSKHRVRKEQIQSSQKRNEETEKQS